ncbi:hypothetical protein ACTFIU_006834 [Dictyostelium citrinum]
MKKGLNVGYIFTDELFQYSHSIFIRSNNNNGTISVTSNETIPIEHQTEIKKVLNLHGQKITPRSQKPSSSSSFTTTTKETVSSSVSSSSKSALSSLFNVSADLVRKLRYSWYWRVGGKNRNKSCRLLAKDIKSYFGFSLINNNNNNNNNNKYMVFEVLMVGFWFQVISSWVPILLTKKFINHTDIFLSPFSRRLPVPIPDDPLPSVSSLFLLQPEVHVPGRVLSRVPSRYPSHHSTQLTLKSSSTIQTSLTNLQQH